jgi:hypothetical protein
MHNIDETIFSVYASKRRAEVAPGVGRETDMAIIDENGVHDVGQPVLTDLEKLYQEYQTPVTEQVVKKVSAMNILGGKQNDAK